MTADRTRCCHGYRIVGGLSLVEGPTTDSGCGSGDSRKMYHNKIYNYNKKISTKFVTDSKFYEVNL